MNKLMSYLILGLLVIVDVTSKEWFVYLTAAVTVLAVVVPCVIYYLRTPPGIDHR